MIYFYGEVGRLYIFDRAQICRENPQIAIPFYVFGVVVAVAIIMPQGVVLNKNMAVFSRMIKY